MCRFPGPARDPLPIWFGLQNSGRQGSKSTPLTIRSQHTGKGPRIYLAQLHSQQLSAKASEAPCSSFSPSLPARTVSRPIILHNGCPRKGHQRQDPVQPDGELCVHDSYVLSPTCSTFFFGAQRRAMLGHAILSKDGCEECCFARSTLLKSSPPPQPMALIGELRDYTSLLPPRGQ